jgi:hypothetical protein
MSLLLQLTLTTISQKQSTSYLGWTLRNGSKYSSSGIVCMELTACQTSVAGCTQVNNFGTASCLDR